ncbi:MAG: hypothetical protein ACFFCZ_21045 [Promethearchaeota archaeon]
MKNFTCSLKHPLYTIISNKTRLEIIRTIVCEKNYGSRIASILKISAPAIHRHMRFLSKTFKDQDKEPITFIRPSYRTIKSYSGYKGAEATVYELGAKIYLSLALYPNFVNTHVFSTSLDNDRSQESSTFPVPNKETSFENHKDNNVEREISEKEIMKRFSELYTKTQEKNQEIKDLEQKLLEVFEEKDKIMKEMDDIILRSSQLTFDERVSLRTLACQGPDCIRMLPEILKKDKEIAQKVLRDLRDNGWFESINDEIQYS